MSSYSHFPINITHHPSSLPTPLLYFHPLNLNMDTEHKGRLLGQMVDTEGAVVITALSFAQLQNYANMMYQGGSYVCKSEYPNSTASKIVGEGYLKYGNILV